MNTSITQLYSIILCLEIPFVLYTDLDYLLNNSSVVLHELKSRNDKWNHWTVNHRDLLFSNTTKSYKKVSSLRSYLWVQNDSRLLKQCTWWRQNTYHHGDSAIQTNWFTYEICCGIGTWMVHPHRNISFQKSVLIITHFTSTLQTP